MRRCLASMVSAVLLLGGIARAQDLSLGDIRTFSTLPMTQPQTALLADMNRDGRLDAVAASTGDPARYGMWTGLGDGALGQPLAEGMLWNHVYSMAIADFDGDGTLDMAAVNYSACPG